MTRPLTAPNTLYTYADYCMWPDEMRVELIEGKVYELSPAPGSRHQIISGELFYNMRGSMADGACKIFSAPFDVRLPKAGRDDRTIFSVVQPDICVVCDPAKIDERGCIGAPDLVVEVFSPGNISKEVKKKYDLYEQSGVREYWMVSPQDLSVIICTLKDGQYMPSRPFTVGDVVTSTVLTQLNLELAVVFKDYITNEDSKVE